MWEFHCIISEYEARLLDPSSLVQNTCLQDTRSSALYGMHCTLLPATCQSCQAEQVYLEVSLLILFAAVGSLEHTELLLLHKILQGPQLCIAPEEDNPL